MGKPGGARDGSSGVGQDDCDVVGWDLSCWSWS